VSTQINVTVGSGGLSDKARQLQTAARQAQLEKERTINLSAEALDKRVAAQAAKGLSPDGLPLYGTSFKQPQIERRPAASRNQNTTWKSLLTEPPFLIYNEPLEYPEFFVGSGSGPVALGYFKAEGRSYQYLYSAQGLSPDPNFPPGQDIISYESVGPIGPYLLSTFSGRPDSKGSIARMQFRRILEYDTGDLQTLAQTSAVLEPTVEIRPIFSFNTFKFDAWFGFTAAQTTRTSLVTGETFVIKSGWTLRTDITLRGESQTENSNFSEGDFTLTIIHNGGGNRQEGTTRLDLSCTVWTLDGPLSSNFIIFSYLFSTTTDTLLWVNYKLELVNNGSLLLLYIRKSIEDPYELAISGVLNNPLPQARRYVNRVTLRSGAGYSEGFPPETPPPVALGPMNFSYR
jgi:hypothetical protein